MTETVTAPTNNRSASLLLQKSRLVDQASAGPSLRDAAAQLLQTAMKALGPDQEINPDKTMIASPTEDQDHETTLAFHFESLTHALIRLAYSKTTANYIEGEHFLTLAPHASDPVHLAISMDAITQLLNDNAPFLFVILEQRQLDFWNATGEQLPRWQELSDTLKAALDVQSADGWNADQCALARLITQQPDKALRTTTGTALSDIRACLLDIDLVDGQTTTHLLLAAALVLTATLQNRELIVMYTIENGYESFSSLAELGASLPARINDLDLTGRRLQWRLYEPEGNYFDAAVWALIGEQLDAIDALAPSSPAPLPRKTADATEHGSPVSARDNARFKLLNKAVPDWLLAGSIDELQAYSRYITDLGALRAQAANDSTEEIPVIQAFAQKQMCDAIVADKEEAAHQALNEIRITVTQSFEVGGFTLPDPMHERYETLGEFALQNTPPYLATVAYADGKPAPSWMTVDYLSRISSQVDIGTTYPKLLKRHLIDDPVQALREKQRFHRELPLLLPLLALECKLKQEGGVDERGYRYVCQLMDAIKSGQSTSDHPVNIRPLAFMPRHRLGHTPDTVVNVYIIGPRDRSAGPCLLYAPLLDQPLRQFPSLQNLVYALYQPGELRDSVLAWLPTQALSFEYAQYVFSSGLPSPWTVTQLAFEPFIHLDLTGTVKLADTPLTGDVLASLFTAHSQAMVELADRQSTSNAERRWSILADSGWAIFSIAANFLTGAAGTAVWVWQSINQIQQALDAHERGDTLVEWTSIGDVLLALGIILTQRWASRRIHALQPGRKKNRSVLPTETSLTLPALKPTEFQAPDAPTGPLPPSHLTALAPNALPRSTTEARFVRQIDSFKVTAPNLPHPPQPSANHLHEFNAKLYAQVGERWFQVRVEDDIVTIVDPDDPSRVGFEVRYDPHQGQWYWDLKLRLRGGAPPGRIEAMRQAKTRRNQDAWVALHRFLVQEEAKKNAVTTAMEALSVEETPATTFDETATGYLAQADELAKGYSQALDDLEQWRETGGAGVFYQAQLMRLTIEQHRYTGAWLRVKMRKYAITTKPLVEHLESGTPMPRDKQIEIAGTAIQLSDEMIERLQRLHLSLDKLTATTRPAQKVGAALTKLLPTFTQLDLEANEIGMSNELCVRERPGKNLQEVRQLVVKIFEKAANSVHQLIELEDAVQPPETQEQRIDLLATLVDQLAGTEQRLQELSTAWPDHLDTARLDRIKRLIKNFHELARSRLLKRLPEPEETTPITKPEPGPSTSRPVVKVTKSRARSGSDGDIPTSEKTEQGEKIPLIKISSTRPKPSATLDDECIVASALSLNAEVDDFIRRTRADAQRPGRIPADMKDLLDQHATRLEQAASDVEATNARRNAAAEDPFPVATLPGELRWDAVKIRKEGIKVYSAMIKARKPREAYLKWLENNQQVEIVDDGQGRIKTKQRKDYFKEYKILDKTRENQALWVAHFHYDNLTDPADQFTAAHLKFSDAYLQSLDTKTRQQLDTFDAVDNALRRIIDPVVRDLFLKPETRTTPQI